LGRRHATAHLTGIIQALPANSRGFLMVIPQEPAQSLAALHSSLAFDVCIARKKQYVVLPLMIALSMVMRNIFAQRPPQ
jgi:hypothetical protein